jgi:adenylate cyclase class 1
MTTTSLYRRWPNTGVINPDDYVDFVTVSDIEPGEFFGVTLWQITGAIGSPHKSLLKVLLLEAYASDFPRLDLMSGWYKRAVHVGEHACDKLDAYLLR